MEREADGLPRICADDLMRVMNEAIRKEKPDSNARSILQAALNEIELNLEEASPQGKTEILEKTKTKLLELPQNDDSDARKGVKKETNRVLKKLKPHCALYFMKRAVQFVEKHNAELRAKLNDEQSLESKLSPIKNELKTAENTLSAGLKEETLSEETKKIFVKYNLSYGRCFFQNVMKDLNVAEQERIFTSGLFAQAQKAIETKRKTLILKIMTGMEPSYVGGAGDCLFFCMVDNDKPGLYEHSGPQGEDWIREMQQLRAGAKRWWQQREKAIGEKEFQKEEEAYWEGSDRGRTLGSHIEKLDDFDKHEWGGHEEFAFFIQKYGRPIYVLEEGQMPVKYSKPGFDEGAPIFLRHYRETHYDNYRFSTLEARLKKEKEIELISKEACLLNGLNSCFKAITKNREEAAAVKTKQSRKSTPALFKPEETKSENISQVRADITNPSNVSFSEFVREQLKDENLKSKIGKIEEHLDKKGFDVHLKDKSTLTVKEKMMQTNDFKSDSALNLMLSLIEKAKKLNMTFKISARYSKSSQKEDLQALLDALGKLREMTANRQITNIDIPSIDNAKEALKNEIEERELKLTKGL